MNKEILRLALPNIISNLSVPLLSTVDTVLMGHLSASHLGAIGIGAMIYNFIYWNFGFLRMGTTGFTAQAFGAKDYSEIINNLIRGTIVAVSISAIVLLLSSPLLFISFKGFNVIENQEEMVAEYFYTRMWAVPAAMLIMVFKGWFFGLQNAIFPLMMTIIANVVNIIISWILVKEMGMETRGVALGTVIGQYTAMLVALFLILKKYRFYFNHLSKTLLLKVDEIRRFFSVNTDIFVRTIFLSSAFAFFYSKSSESGDEIILAVNVILLNLVNWMSYGIDGFAYAAESMVGKYKGAEDEQKLSRSIRLAMIWGGSLAVGYSMVYALLYEPIISLFTNESSVILQSFEFKFWMILFPLAAFLCYIWDGIFVGLTASKSLRNASILSFIAFIIIYYVFETQISNHAIWLALFVFLLGRGLIQSFQYKLRGQTLK